MLPSNHRSLPDTNPGLSTTRRVARSRNEYAAQLVRDHPTRVGFFATLPLPDVEGSLSEIAYAFDVFKADGIGLMTNYRTNGLVTPRSRRYSRS